LTREENPYQEYPVDLNKNWKVKLDESKMRKTTTGFLPKSVINKPSHSKERGK
jgi:hypothetical protein